MIADRPDSAYEICTKYAPSCSGGQSASINGNSNGASRSSSSYSSSSQTGSSSSQSASSRSEAALEQRSMVNGRHVSPPRNTESPAVLASRNQIDRTTSIDRNAFRNLGIDSAAASGSLNIGAAPMSRDNSGESDGLGASFNGEDDYYDSINSGDENESLNNRSSVARTSSPIAPVYNPEPGIDMGEPEENCEPGITCVDKPPTTSNTTTFSTIVNGVKIKSLPGPRGINSLISSRHKVSDLFPRRCNFKKRTETLTSGPNSCFNNLKRFFLI